MFEVGAFVRPSHANAHGTGHGGFLATFADQLLGLSVAHILGAQSMTTLSLNLDYLQAAPIGSWISGHARVLHMGGRTAFADCVVETAGKPILRANATFRLYRQSR